GAGGCATCTCAEATRDPASRVVNSPAFMAENEAIVVYPRALLQRARLDLPVRILAGHTGVAHEVGLARDAVVAIELPLQPGHGYRSVWAAVVLAVGAAV